MVISAMLIVLVFRAPLGDLLRAMARNARASSHRGQLASRFLVSES